MLNSCERTLDGDKEAKINERPTAYRLPQSLSHFSVHGRLQLAQPLTSPALNHGYVQAESSANACALFAGR